MFLCLLFLALLAAQSAHAGCIRAPDLSTTVAEFSSSQTSRVGALIQFGERRNLCFGLEYVTPSLLTDLADLRIRDVTVLRAVELIFGEPDIEIRLDNNVIVVTRRVPLVESKNVFDEILPRFAVRRSPVQEISAALYMQLLLNLNPAITGFAGHHSAGDARDLVGPISESNRSIRYLLNAVVSESKGGVWIARVPWKRRNDLQIAERHSLWSIIEYGQRTDYTEILNSAAAEVSSATPVDTFGQTRTTEGQHVPLELQRDLTELDSYLSYRNLDTLQAVVDRQSAKWQKKDRGSFILYMSKACSLLSSYDIGDISRRASLLSQYAMGVLASGDLSIKDQVQFVEFLMFDPLRMDEASWRDLREKKAKLWLATRRRLMESVDPTFDFADRGFINVAAPPAAGVPAGSAPESIQDPKLRSEYELAIAQNSAKARRYNDQYWLKRTSPWFYKDSERYLINAYSTPPADFAQLEQLLSQYAMDEGTRSRILDEVRKRISQ